MNHKLSVTIPSYRQPKALSRAFEALEAQTFKDFDVIIIDDNSGADLSGIMERFSGTLDIKLVHNEQNLGAMKNMMKSIMYPTQAEYVFSHHEDDYIKSDYLEHAVHLLDTHPNTSFVLSSAVWVASNEPFTSSRVPSFSPLLMTFGDFLKASLERTPFIFGSVVYRKKHVVGEFDLQAYHTLCDKIFLAEILRLNTGLCAYIPSPAIYVHDHSLDKKDTRSSGARVEHVTNYFAYYKEHLPRSPFSDELITNGVLLAYSNLPGQKSLLEFISRQKHHKLISLKYLNKIGIFSLLTLPFPVKTRIALTRFAARMVK